MLKEVNLPSHRRFKSRTEWEPIGFFSDCLCNSTQFDLMLGFFSSSAINLLSYGFASFLYNGGRMRLIVNDILTEQDKKAIASGEMGASLLPYFDITNIELLKNTLSERDAHFFDCLAWLIRNNRLEIRIVAPKEGIGISHTKTGVFSDGLNEVGFDGSCNFSRTALIDNLESLTVSCNWDGSIPTATINSLKDDFELVFTGKDESVVFISADKVRTQIEGTFKNKELKELLEDEYKFIQQDISDKSLPQTVINALGNAKSKVEIEIEKTKAKTASGTLQNHEPCFPYESGPRDYQKQAFENWKNNGQKGLFAMATGTGKTITALNCLLEIYKRNGYYKAIILVPTITLVEQWETECRKFHFNNVVKLYSRNKNWQDQVERITLNEKCQKGLDKGQNFIVISTYASFSRDNIFAAINCFKKAQVLLIADESHNMGSPRIISRLASINYLRRLGLSATPERQFEDRTNNKLFTFFGAKNEYTYEYSMEEAIKNGVLCKYYYYPHLIKLTEVEMDQYLVLSKKIAKYFNYTTSSFEKEDDVLKMLLLARKRIVHKAANKLEIFKKIVQNRFASKGDLKYSLIYVPEGNRPDYLSGTDYFDYSDQIDDDFESDHLIDQYTEIILNVNKYITVRKFTAGQKDRDTLLNDFANGKIQVLTSMKCLDEGIDVPRSEFAVFCSSTGNPRQFIQRRGRVLRKHKDKHMAEIHDLVVAPEVGSFSESYKMERALLRNELLRVKEFSMLSINPSTSQLELLPVMNHYGLNLYNNN